MNTNTINELIARYCSMGVEYAYIGDILGVNRGKRLTKKDLSDSGQFFVYHGSKDTPLGKYHKFNAKGDTVIVVNTGGIGGVAYCKDAFWCSDGSFYLGHSSRMNNKFVYYYLSQYETYFFNHKRIGGVPTIDRSIVEMVKIPVPSLSVQEEIVRILDAFFAAETELEVKLKAEQDFRKKQYKYHLNQLLSFDKKDKSVKFMQLGEIGTFIKGNGLQKKDFTDSGVGCIHYGQIYTYYGTYTQQTKSFVSEELAKKLKKAQKGDLIIATTSENVEDVGKAVAWLGNESICIGGHSTVFHHNQNPKYMAYLFQTEIFFKQKQKVAKGVKVIDISDKAMSKFKFGFPSIEEQERIVSILDELNKLTNEISDSLQAEITARKKQYEYYRNKLLTFKEAV